jgi:hypothetical protein
MNFKLFAATLFGCLLFAAPAAAQPPTGSCLSATDCDLGTGSDSNFDLDQYLEDLLINDYLADNFGGACLTQDAPPGTCSVEQTVNHCTNSCYAGAANQAHNCPSADMMDGVPRHYCLIDVNTNLQTCLMSCPP